MSDTNPTPGKSLESDLRLIREAKGLSREDIFNRVHIRPEVLAQVEEHGFKATPTLNSDIHRRSFVKHYADAVGIDSEVALRALETSVTGLYDGSLAVEYLGLDELKPVPRWAQGGEEAESKGAESSAEDSPEIESKEEESADRAEKKEATKLEKVKLAGKAEKSKQADKATEPEEATEPDKATEPEKLDKAEVSKERNRTEKAGEQSGVTEEQPDLPEFNIPTAPGQAVFPVPETEPPKEDREIDKPESAAKGRPDDHAHAADQDKSGHGEGAAAESPPTKAAPKAPDAEQKRSAPEPDSPAPEAEAPVPEAEAPAPGAEAPAPGAEAPAPESEAPAPESEPAAREPEPAEPAPAGQDKPKASKIEDAAEPASPYAPPMPGRQAPPAKKAASKPLDEPSETEHGETPEESDSPGTGESSPRRRAPATIPSSTLKESVIGPLDEEDFGDEVSFWVKLRGRHWLAWIGLTGVAVIVLALVVQAIVMNNGEEEGGRVRISSVAQLPDQFSGIVRLTPTTERFVTLQITPDSVSNSDFVYKIWTHSAGSTFAETGVGSLNTSNNQILLGEPYGVGGLFVLENGRYRLRSVRRVRFPKWEFTGHTE